MPSVSEVPVLMKGWFTAPKAGIAHTSRIGE
jgi:hypothetical protein